MKLDFLREEGLLRPGHYEDIAVGRHASGGDEVDGFGLVAFALEGPSLALGGRPAGRSVMDSLSVALDESRCS